MNVECACAVWDVERILEVTVLLLHTNPLLTHNHNANTIEYKYKIQIQPALIPPTQRWRDEDQVLLRHDCLLPLPHPTHPPPCIFSVGRLVGGDLSILIDALL